MRFHMSLMDNRLKPKVVMESVANDLAALQKQMAGYIHDDLKSIAGTLDAKMPVYSANSILHSPTAMQQVMDADHGSLTTVGLALQHELKFTKLLAKEALPIDVAMVLRAETASNSALATVAIAAVLNCTEREWPGKKFTDLDACRLAVKALRKDVARTGWTPTDQIEELLVEWESGLHLYRSEEAGPGGDAAGGLEAAPKDTAGEEVDEGGGEMRKK